MVTPKSFKLNKKAGHSMGFGKKKNKKVNKAEATPVKAEANPVKAEAKGGNDANAPDALVAAAAKPVEETEGDKAGRGVPSCVQGVRAKLDMVQRIKPRTKLLLYDFDLKPLYGVYKASDRVGENLVFSAFRGNFPDQIKTPDIAYLWRWQLLVEPTYERGIGQPSMDELRVFLIWLNFRCVGKLSTLKQIVPQVHLALAYHVGYLGYVPKLTAAMAFEGR